jgi:hypothetical protein
MTEFPPLANPDVLAWVGERSYAAGLRYARSDAVSHTRMEGLTLKAHCQGTAPEPYRVGVTLDKNGLAAGACSCPVGAGGHCKHVAALLLTWIAVPEEFIAREPLDRALAGLTKDQLVDLLLRLARRSPEVEALLELSLPAPAPASDMASEAVAAEAGHMVDTGAIQREVARTLRQSEPGMASTDESRMRIRRFLDRADAAVDQGAVADAAAIYQTVMETIVEFRDALGNGDEFDDGYDGEYEDDFERDRYDDYDEDEVDPALLEMTGECVDQCVEGLRRCLGASDDHERRAHILDALFALYQSESRNSASPLGNGVPSVILEHATPAERHHVAALARQAMSTLGAHQYDDGVGEWGVGGTRRRLARFWLDLERDTLDEDGYLAFCRETGLTRELVERLLDLGQVEEAAAEASQVEDSRLLPLAGSFTQRGQGDVFAAVVRERARTSGQDFQFLRWLQQNAQEAGRPQVALDYAKTLFWRRPTREGYQELRELARPLEQWDELRRETLAKLEEQRQYTLLTQIHLLEPDVDQALRTVEQLKGNVWGAYGEGDLHIQVARAAEPTHPDAAIGLYRAAANGLISQQGRANYAIAAQHLARVRALFRQQGRGAEWQTLIAGLREQHKRLRALQDEMKQAALFEPEPTPPRQPPAARPRGADRADAANPPPPGPTVHLLRADGTV